MFYLKSHCHTWVSLSKIVSSRTFIVSWFLCGHEVAHNIFIIVLKPRRSAVMAPLSFLILVIYLFFLSGCKFILLFFSREWLFFSLLLSHLQSLLFHYCFSSYFAFHLFLFTSLVAFLLPYSWSSDYWFYIFSLMGTFRAKKNLFKDLFYYYFYFF